MSGEMSMKLYNWLDSDKFDPFAAAHTQIGEGMNALPESVENQFTVLQPGSTVATSLVEGEAKRKHVALLQIYKDRWKLDAVPLETVIPYMAYDLMVY